MKYISHSSIKALLLAFVVATSWQRFFVTAGEDDNSCTNNETLSIDIPIIDISALRNGNKAEKHALSKKIGQACQEIGYHRFYFHFPFLVHNIPLKTLYPYQPLTCIHILECTFTILSGSL